MKIGDIVWIVVGKTNRYPVHYLYKRGTHPYPGRVVSFGDTAVFVLVVGDDKLFYFHPKSVFNTKEEAEATIIKSIERKEDERRKACRKKWRES